MKTEKVASVLSNVQTILAGRDFIYLQNNNAIAAGTIYRGVNQQNVEAVIQYATGEPLEVILNIDHLHFDIATGTGFKLDKRRD